MNSQLFEEIETYLHRQNILLNPGEPVIGHYQPDLVLQADQDAATAPQEAQEPVNPSLASQGPSQHHWHASKAPDAAYYQAQGQEPPLEPEPDPLAFFRGLLHLLEFCAPFMVVAGAVFIMWAVGR